MAAFVASASRLGGLYYYHDPKWEPFWSAAEDLEMNLASHGGFGPMMDPSLPASAVLWVFETLPYGRKPIPRMIFGGVFERHPNLRIACVEADAGWVPHFMYRMDHAYDRHRYWLTTSKLSKKPSEYFSEHIYMTFQDDWVAFKSANMLNPRRLMWANDFPHSDSTWPNSQELLREHSQSLTDEQKNWVLHDNVAEFYGITL